MFDELIKALESYKADVVLQRLQDDDIALVHFLQQHGAMGYLITLEFPHNLAGHYVVVVTQNPNYIAVLESRTPLGALSLDLGAVVDNNTQFTIEQLHSGNATRIAIYRRDGAPCHNPPSLTITAIDPQGNVVSGGNWSKATGMNWVTHRRVPRW